MSRLPSPGRRPKFHSPLPRLGLYPMELARNIRVDSVSRLEPSPPHEIDASAPLAEAVELMRRENASCLLVTESGRLVGLFTERDLLTRVLGKGRALVGPIRAAMTSAPVTVSPKDPVRTAIRRMQQGGYRHLPVVDEDGRPVGILSAGRVVHYLVEHFPALIFNQPPSSNQFPDSPEGA